VTWLDGEEFCFKASSNVCDLHQPRAYVFMCGTVYVQRTDLI
jgi:hypothetical protein